MEQIKIIIEKGKDQYGAWSENVDGIFAAGDTIPETKKNTRPVTDPTTTTPMNPNTAMPIASA